MKASELSGTVKTKYKYIGKKRKKPTFDFDLELISKYFKGIKYRGLYYIEVKQQVVFELRKAMKEEKERQERELKRMTFEDVIFIY